MKKTYNNEQLYKQVRNKTIIGLKYPPVFEHDETTGELEIRL